MSKIAVSKLEQLIKNIVLDSQKLKDEFTDAHNVPVNYACIFTQNQSELTEYTSVASKIGQVIEYTPTAPLFKITPIKTIAGSLQLLKIRKFDEDHTDLGDADFTLPNYQQFKDKYLGQPGFSLVSKPGFEMIELRVSDRSVRCYFSNPPLDKQLGLI